MIFILYGKTSQKPSLLLEFPITLFNHDLQIYRNKVTKKIDPKIRWSSPVGVKKELLATFGAGVFIFPPRGVRESLEMNLPNRVSFSIEDVGSSINTKKFYPKRFS